MTPATLRGSLRFRLLLGTLFWIAASILVAGWGLGNLFRQHVELQFHAELKTHLDQLTAQLALDDQGRPTLAMPLSDPRLNKPFCWPLLADRPNVSTVGSNNESAGQMSPANVLATTITDELKLASNFHSKVWGIAIKDRGAIIPAGHAANGAFWYDSKTGNFITSTYYSKSLPTWMQQFNQRKLVDSFYEKNWTLALDKSVYEQYCDSDENSYEARPFGDNARQMPYTLQSYKGKDYGKIASTPFGNDLLLELAKAIIAGEQMGKGNNTDFLAVSFSSTDYVGHAFGTHSWELLDTYVRLDETLGKLFSYLDKTVGKDQYTVFLSADHPAPHIPAFPSRTPRAPPPSRTPSSSRSRSRSSTGSSPVIPS